MCSKQSLVKRLNRELEQHCLQYPCCSKDIVGRRNQHKSTLILVRSARLQEQEPKISCSEQKIELLC